ncbi:MAG: hypothetical protein AMXMBFR64_20830 [Myxococcales bacterium]
MDTEIQRAVRVARVDLERALRMALQGMGPAAVLAAASDAADGGSEADALAVLSEAARLAMHSPERSVDDLLAECLTTEWMTAAGARLYRVSLKPGQAVTDAHRRLLGGALVVELDSVGPDRVWAGWVDVVRGIHVAFSRVEGAPRVRRVGPEEGRLVATVARAIEARASRGLSVTGLWDRLEALGDAPNTDFLAAAEDVARLSPDEAAVLYDLCVAHLDAERSSPDAQAARAALDELIAGSGVSLACESVDALLQLLRGGPVRCDLVGALAGAEEQGHGLSGVLGHLETLHQKVTGAPLRTSLRERRERCAALCERVGTLQSEVEEVPELPFDHDRDTSSGLPPVLLSVEEAPLGGPESEDAPSAFWEPEIPSAVAQAPLEPSVAALLPRREPQDLAALDPVDISVVRERELEAQLIASDEAREHVRSDAAALDLELERVRRELRQARREAEALRRERAVLMGRVDGAMRMLTGTQGSVVQLLAAIDGSPGTPGALLEPAGTSPGLTRFAIGTAVALLVAAVLIVAYLPSRQTTATGPVMRPAASAPRSKAGLAFAAARPQAPAPVTEAAPAAPESPAASDEELPPEEPQAAAEPAELPPGFEASLMLTRRSKAFVHGDRRTRVVMELPEGPRLVGACVAARSTPEAVGSPVYPGYEPIVIPCTGSYRDVCDALGCDDAADRCDVAVSVVAPCGADPPPVGGGPASAAAPRFEPTLALGARSKIYSRQSRDAVELASLQGGSAVLGRCLFATASPDAAGAKAWPGYEPMSVRCDADTAGLCEALGCINPDGVCHVLASGARACSPR